MTNYRCNICDTHSLSNVLASYDSLDRWQVAAGIAPKASNREWILCDYCGSIQNIMSGPDLNALTKQNSQYYKVDFDLSALRKKYSTITALPNIRSDNYHRCLRVFSAIQQVLLSRYVDTFQVLDVGAGLGIFLDRLSDMFSDLSFMVNCHAIEPDPLAHSFLTMQKRHTCHHTTFGKFASSHKFNLVTFNKVLEHTLDPVNLLIKAKDLLLDSRSIIY